MGTYRVVVQSQFNQPIISGTSKPFSNTFEFTFVVDPCQVASFSPDDTITTINYTLGQAGFTFGPYSFVQSPECGYAESVEVTGLPSFIAHSAATNQFALTSTEDFAATQTYSVTVTSTIQIPNDNSQSAFTAEVASTSF